MYRTAALTVVLRGTNPIGWKADVEYVLEP